MGRYTGRGVDGSNPRGLKCDNRKGYIGGRIYQEYSVAWMIHLIADFRLNSVHCTLFTSYLTLHTVHCILNTAHFKLNSVHCTLYTAYFTLQT